MRIRQATPVSRQHGFTLLEILLASTLLAVLLALAYSTVSGAVRSTRSGEAQIERTDEIRVTQEFLRRQLSHAMPVAYEQPDDGGDRKVFEADDASMRFVAPMPGHLSRGGLHVQWLEFSSDRDGLRLDFDHHQLNGYDPDDPKGDSERPPVTLLEGIAEASFEFRSLDEQGELGDWDSDWEDFEALPVLVRLNLRFENENRQWPLFEVPMKLAAASTTGSRFRPRRSSQLGRPLPGDRK
ncbi:MAG: prepilin-type N-terminal cleavage/methylation domain-containing protein [Lysobacteraceae bacterium]